MSFQVIDNFIEDLYLDEMLKFKTLNDDEFQDTGIVKYTSEMDADQNGYFVLAEKLNRQIIARLAGLAHDLQSHALTITLSILRINWAKYEGTLHHDKNVNARRKLSVILYCNRPEQGGELVFPCYDKKKMLRNNTLTNQLIGLGQNKQFYSDDLEDSVDIKSAFIVKPAANRAVIIDNRDPAAWHKSAKVIKGFKIAYITFFE